jgi:Protein of unknown function (DUF3300)
MPKLLAQALAFMLFVLFAQGASAQTQPSPASASADQLLKPEQLDALVSPIALYPDTLLAEVLMASTYPLEVVQAARWLEENKNLKGDALKAAVNQQGWDDSVKSLTATPSALNMMSSKLDWTQKLGDAVLAQQADVMDSIQRLRAKADANDKLKSTKEQKVTKKSEGGKQYIAIEPTDPQTVYVPYYDPAVVYGAWPYPAYPPYYWPSPYPGYVAGAAIATGLAFGAGYAVGRWASGGNYWGGGVNWGGNNINVNRPVNINNSGNNWTHNSDHRHGVRYNNTNVANKFNKGNNVRNGAQNRMDFRGHNGQAALRPDGNRPGGGDRPGAGNRPGGGDRPGAGNRPGGGDRPGAGNRPGGGDRPSAGNRPGGGDRPSAGNRPGGGNRPSAGARPGGGGGGRSAFAGSGAGGRGAMAQASRGHASMGARGGGGGMRAGGGGGGGMRGGGGGGRGGGGGGRRSDIALKHDIILLGHLDNGLGFYRFSYIGSDKAYVGVMAQEVQTVMPAAVVRGSDGYLRVFYDRLGVKFETYDQWIASGARIPSSAASGLH